MLNIDLHQLIRLLSQDLRRDLEAAAAHCLQRGGHSVQPEDLLLCLLQRPDSLLQRALLASGKEPDVIASALQLAGSPAEAQRNPVLSSALIAWLQQALLLASTELQQRLIDQRALLLAWLRSPPANPELLATLNAEQVLEQDNQGHGAESEPPDQLLEEFTQDLTRQAKEGELDPVLGRESELRQLIDILCRRRKSNPAILGEAGVGKSALVEGLAQRIIAGTVPGVLRDYRVLALDLGLLQAGAGMRGELERRLQGVLRAASQPGARIILFIDEAHTLIGHGGDAGTADTANLLKPALARGNLKAIAATTWSEYRRHIDKDPALARRFQPVILHAPDVAQATAVLRGLAPRYAADHGLHITDEAIVAAVELAARYLPDRQLPDKAIDLLDTACARTRVNLACAPLEVEHLQAQAQQLQQHGAALEHDHRRGLTVDLAELDHLQSAQPAALEQAQALHEHWARQRALAEQLHQDDQQQGSVRADLVALQQDLPLVSAEVDRRAVAEVVSGWTGIPLTRLQGSRSEQIARFADQLAQRLHGQQEAIVELDQGLRAAALGLSRPDRPSGVFLLVGPSGVGKTATAEAIAELLYGGPDFLTIVNMGEYQEPHSLARLIGAPPGYVGYGEGGQLTEAVRRRPYSVVLLDEVEKAHPQLLNLFYQIFDKGTANDGEGREIDFRNTLILLTSNLASEQINHLCQAQRPQVASLLKHIEPSLRAHFKPALLARMRVLPYYPMGTDALAAVARQRLQRLADRLSARQLSVTYEAPLAAHIATQCHTEGGARLIERWIERHIQTPIANQLLANAPSPRTLHLSVAEQGGICCDFA
ncbi:type VI secretion system ATPase TssH [Pseudomonas abyssi]|uniref:ClpV1 family T6SS ATPase n=1 Tax=Pseudomonas abyssi TaxID=170540 RepID=A0A395R9N8_9PSED|nr:type VI secretion system ATPase TssH [Halopseudomonas gallaeciensis]RGP56805.1 ClpV1 family T6SS ATPase [Halopseudomonas gallaeciensis]